MLYNGESLSYVSFPLGGIGSGSVSLAGNGAFIDWEIFGKPNKCTTNGFTHIGVRAKWQGKECYRVLQGDHQTDFIGVNSQSGYGMGVSNKTMAGFRHFENCEFLGEFPFANITFSDRDFPGEVVLKAFNPLIPRDDKNSSLPAAFFEITFNNTTESDVEFEPYFSLMNPFSATVNEKTQKGVLLKNFGKTADELGYGELCLIAENPEQIVPFWFRGRANDAVTVFMNEIKNGGRLTAREYSGAAKNDTATVTSKCLVPAKSSKSFRFVLSWYVPNMSNDWINKGDEDEPLDSALLGASWKHYYATLFKSAREVADYALENWDYLYEETHKYKNALYSATLDSAVIDAVASGVAVLKSSAVYRLPNGEFYGFEGTESAKGSCPGTCQHVYNYAYALCFLFPELERSIRDLEFAYSMAPSGAHTFRMPLPPSAPKKLHPCLDGQAGAVIKAYREWKISGDNEWLKSNWSAIKLTLEFIYSSSNPWKWDINADGVLEGKQHNTLDLDVFGPTAWHQGLYLAALKAGAEMAEFLGEDDKKKEYLSIYEKGRAFTNEELFGGEYFIQKIDLTDKSILNTYSINEDDLSVYWSDELGEIKYQTGEGSSIDQLCGQWHANILGLGRIFDKDKTDSALRAMYKYNFQKKLRDYDNTWRIYALNDEGGAVICAYPEGAKRPQVPIMYTEECMSGFEYELAELLISEGEYDKGIELVRAVRHRFNGKKRNPFSEIECGSNYARSMASFALLPIISGFEFDLPRGIIGFSPKTDKENFNCPWFLGTGWGSVNITPEKTEISLSKGEIKISEIRLPYIKHVQKVLVDGRALPFTFANGKITFESTTIEEKIEVIV